MKDISHQIAEIILFIKGVGSFYRFGLIFIQGINLSTIRRNLYLAVGMVCYAA